MAAHTVAAMEDFDPLNTEDQDAQRQVDAEKAELKRIQDDADFTWLMSDARGRRIVWAQLAAAGIYNTSFDPAAMTMAFNEGRRSEGLRLLARVTSLCPKQYLTMMKEQQQ